ncbi:MAG TPA: DUF4129 domain-containing protein [Armatimonadota bacterium]|jgi:hypothetical protein
MSAFRLGLLGLLLAASLVAADPAPSARPAASPAAVSVLTAERIRTATADTLREARFRTGPSPRDLWLQRIQKAIIDWLERWGDTLLGSASLAAKLEAFFWGFVALVALALLGLLARAVVVAWLRRAEAPATKKITAAPPLRPESPASLRARAEALAAAGQYGPALRWWQQACLQALDRRGLVAVRRSATNGEYLRQLLPHPEPRARFSALTGLVELHMFGGAVLSEGQYQQGLEQARALLEGDGA